MEEGLEAGNSFLFIINKGKGKKVELTGEELKYELLQDDEDIGVPKDTIFKTEYHFRAFLVENKYPDLKKNWNDLKQKYKVKKKFETNLVWYLGSTVSLLSVFLFYLFVIIKRGS